MATTANERLTGLAFLLPVLLAALAYGARNSRRGRRWPWSAAIGVAVVTAGLMGPWLPVVLAGGAFFAADVGHAHGVLGTHGARRRRGRPGDEPGA